jgi:hypothetical protein
MHGAKIREGELVGKLMGCWVEKLIGWLDEKEADSV